LVRFGTKWLDLEAQALRDDEGNEHPLTASEFGLLKVFAANPKRVLSRERLLELANARDSRSLRSRRRPADHANPAQDRIGSDQARGDPHHPRRRLSVLAVRRQGLTLPAKLQFLMVSPPHPLRLRIETRPRRFAPQDEGFPRLPTVQFSASLKLQVFSPECFVAGRCDETILLAHETIFRLACRHPETFAN
jgi:hypothetical protein